MQLYLLLCCVPRVTNYNNNNNQAVTEIWFLEIFYIVVDRTIVHAPLIVFHTSFSNTNFQSSFYGLGAKTEMLYFEKIA